MKTPSLRLSSLALARVSALAGALTLLAGGCGEAPAALELLGEPACRELVVDRARAARNVIVVLNDAMRRDALGIYGGAAKTPHFDEFAREHLVFDHAVSQAPWTKPSIATLFTSLYPSQHRVESHPFLRAGSRGSSQGAIEADVLAPSLVTLAEVLRESGMRTGAVIGNPWMVRDFGFDRGFDVYDDSFARWHVSGNELVDAGLEWIESLDEDERFFLYLHTVDSHRPYGRVSGADHATLRATYNGDRQLTDPIDRAFAGRIRLQAGGRAAEAGLEPTESLLRAAYQGGIEEFDAILGRLLTALRSNEELWAETAIILTSDHGESLYERGIGNHGRSLHDEEAAVPLVARLPGVEPAQGHVKCLVGLVDVMPSLCSYLDVDCPESTQGWSFLPRERENLHDDRRFLVTEGVMHLEDHRSIRDRRFKLLYEPRGRDDAIEDTSSFTFIDLEADPHERFNHLEEGWRTAETDRVFSALRAALHTSVATLPAPQHGRAKITPKIKERLEALGYSQ